MATRPSGSATREAITKSQLEDFKIPVPLLTEQANFVAKIAAAQRIIDEAPAQKQAVLKKFL